MASPLRTVALLCAAEALSMLGFATYPTLLPALSRTWSLTSAEAGLIAGAFFGGYMLAVPFLSGLTDRVDSRLVYALGTLLAAAGSIGFALAASGPVSALLAQAVAGAGLAGTYMPGLRALTDRVSGPRQSRYVAFYTSTFGIGTSLSLAFAGMAAQHMDWPALFALTALGPALACLLVLRGLAAHVPPGRSVILDYRPVLSDRRVLGYVLGYGAHCWELFGLRSWMVAFLAMAFAGAALELPQPAAVAAAINLLGIPASILGNELAMRVGRRALIAAAMTGSAVLAVLTGVLGPTDPWLAIGLVAAYFVLVMSDSASLTAGLVSVSAPMQRGAAMAVYSLVGFGAGFLSPLAFGLALDWGGSAQSRGAWGWAFASLGVTCALGAVVSWRAGRTSNTRSEPDRRQGP